MNFKSFIVSKQNHIKVLLVVLLLIAVSVFVGRPNISPEEKFEDIESIKVVVEEDNVSNSEDIESFNKESKEQEENIIEEEPKVEDKIEEEIVNTPVTPVSDNDYYLILKDVGEPYLERFGLSPADFNNIKAAGFDIISGNFDICATPSDVLLFLQGAHTLGFKVIMTAGAGEAEWGYPCDENFDSTLKPVWQKELVQAWVKRWAYHPAIYAWDISNEDGQNFPNAGGVNENWATEGYALTTKQLQTAYRDVKEADPTRPVMIRMNGWFFYDHDSNFFRAGNAFGSGIADIVMINAYSNIGDYLNDFVGTVSARANNSITAIEPGAKIIISLGTWEEPPLWFTPSLVNLKNDVSQVNKIDNLLGVAVFKYGAEESDWWMPRDALSIWNEFKDGILKQI